MECRKRIIEGRMRQDARLFTDVIDHLIAHDLSGQPDDAEFSWLDVFPEDAIREITDEYLDQLYGNQEPGGSERDRNRWIIEKAVSIYAWAMKEDDNRRLANGELA